MSLSLIDANRLLAKGINPRDARDEEHYAKDSVLFFEFGRRSEHLDPDQLALTLEDIDGDIGRIKESRPTIVVHELEAPLRRKPLPDHLPRKGCAVRHRRHDPRLLWRCAACHGRERERDPGLDSSAAARDPHHSSPNAPAELARP